MRISFCMANGWGRMKMDVAYIKIKVEEIITIRVVIREIQLKVRASVSVKWIHE